MLSTVWGSHSCASVSSRVVPFTSWQCEHENLLQMPHFHADETNPGHSGSQHLRWNAATVSLSALPCVGAVRRNRISSWRIRFWTRSDLMSFSISATSLAFARAWISRSALGWDMGSCAIWRWTRISVKCCLRSVLINVSVKCLLRKAGVNSVLHCMHLDDVTPSVVRKVL